MKVFQWFTATKGPRNLQDYIRLVIGFYTCLMALALYQQVRLYAYGALDGVFNANLLLLFLNHLGYASLVGLFGVLVFRVVERRKSGWGFRLCIALFVGLLVGEALLTEYYIDTYELAGRDFQSAFARLYNPVQFLMVLSAFLVTMGSLFRLSYRTSKRAYRLISNLFPSTIILFTLFLATLLADKRPVNVNKSQFLAASHLEHWFGEASYAGTTEHPFWNAREGETFLQERIHWKETPPHIVLVVVDGLASDFIGSDAPFAAVTPFMDSLRQQALYWPNFLANSRESTGALSAITASLPMAGSGPATRYPDRYSLFSVLKQAGYRTSFQYGGNSSLHGWDRLLFEERVDALIDQKSFGQAFSRQEEDAAGVTAGYPDEALFTRFLESLRVPEVPRLDVFQTLSGTDPENVPGAETLESEVLDLLETLPLDRKTRRMARKNKEHLAAMRYTDQALRKFISWLSKKETYPNTLFILTGSHRPKGMWEAEPLAGYRVPLMVFGPLLKVPEQVNGLASHLDIAPGVLAALEEQFNLPVPRQTAWMGQGFAPVTPPEAGRRIPLLGNPYGAGDFVEDGRMVSGKRAYTVQPDFGLAEIEGPQADSLKVKAREFRAKYLYVNSKNRLIPEDAVLFEPLFKAPEKQDLVWIQSVFSGSDFDKAYSIARNLAHNGERRRARLLCHYILSEVPGHVDTEILLGRIYAWEGRYDRAMDILEQVVSKYPVYEDGYAALLDVYFWAGQSRKAHYLAPAIAANLNGNERLREKMQRANQSLQP